MKASFSARAWRGAAVMVCVLALFAAPLLAHIDQRPGAAASAFEFAGAPAPRPLLTPLMRGFPYDWSHHHLIFSRPSSPAQMLRLEHEPRYLIQRAWRARNLRSASAVEYMQALDATALQLASGHPVRQLLIPHAARPLPKPRLGGDWSVNMGSNAKVGAGKYPAKFSFNPIGAPDCTNDFVVFNTGLTGSGSQASVIAYNNLYKTTCTANPPSVYWSYKTGGKILNSAVLSGDGSQVALIHDGGAGAASLVLLKWKGGEGTGTPATPTTVTTTPATYVTCKIATPAQSCQLTLTFASAFNDSHSAPFYDYGSDILYVGDDGGDVHKFTGVFNGTPAEAGPPWPIIVTANAMLSGPVLDSGASPPVIVVNDLTSSPGGHVDFFALPSPSSTATPVITRSTRIGVSATDITDAPVVDSTSAGHYYVEVSTDSKGNSGLFVFTRGFSNNSSGTEATIGTGTASAGATVQPVYAGDFDNKYYSSNNATGNLYVCGNAGTNPALFQVPLTSGSPPASATSSPASIVTNPSGANPQCSPITEIFNTTATGGPFDWIFLSVQNFGTPANCSSGGCVMNFLVTAWLPNNAYSLGQEILDTKLNVQKVTTAGTSGATTPSWATSGTTADGTVTWTFQSAMTVNASRAEPGGTSGIVIDNTSSTTGASQVYFSTLSNGTCATSGTIGGCAVQASQSGLSQ